MANQEQLDILKRGVETWNKWRDENPSAVIDLKDARLSSAQTLVKANLAGADLSGSHLSGLYLTGAVLAGADLSGATLSGAILAHANLSGADFFRADLSNVDFTGATLTGTNLAGANLSDTSFFSVKLGGTSFFKAKLTNAVLPKMNLSSCNLAGADLSGADLSNAQLPQNPLTKEQLASVRYRPEQGMTPASPPPPAAALPPALPELELTLPLALSGLDDILFQLIKKGLQNKFPDLSFGDYRAEKTSRKILLKIAVGDQPGDTAAFREAQAQTAVYREQTEARITQILASQSTVDSIRTQYDIFCDKFAYAFR